MDRIQLGDRATAGLIAVAIGALVSGFLLSVSFDEPQVGGIVLFAGVAALIVMLTGSPGRDREPAGPDTAWPRNLLVLSLGVVPAVLVVIEIFHPHGFSDHVYEYLSQPEDLYFGPDWWTALHVVQTPLVGIVGAGLLLAVRRIPGTLAWLTRIATIFFVIYYTALDTLAGVGIGVLIDHTKDWTGERRETANELVQFLFTDDWVGGTSSAYSEIASWAAFLALAGVALTLARAHAPVVAAFLIGAAAVLIQIAHTRPYGPLGFACILAAAILLVPWRARHPVRPTGSLEPTGSTEDAQRSWEDARTPAATDRLEE